MMIQKTGMQKSMFFFILVVITIISFAFSQSGAQSSKNGYQINLIESNCDQQSTIFVHGTLFCLSWLVRLFDCPLGLTPAPSKPAGFIIGKIPHILHASSPTMFPLNKSYLWGWHGQLSFEARKKASHKLYHAIKSIPGPKTIIGQSHGCNVALNLAYTARKHHDKNFFIDRLILLAPPVQEATAYLIESHQFKKVFSLYSSEDLIQILDPQGLYKETKRRNENPKLFSEKIFKPAPNLVQAEIVIADIGPSHMDFVKEKFMKHLPNIIDMLDKATQNKSDYEKFHYKINIPLVGKPLFVTDTTKI